jgi:NACHT domain/Heterokaryon incompatibility protein (HET)
MRLLKRSPNGTIELHSFDDDSPPQYAILSHTWGEESQEVTFEDMTSGAGARREGFKKITFCGEQAARDGLEYFWVDTCCINKKIPAELQHAISSMFRWYRRSTKCYVYLVDVQDEKRRNMWEQAFRQSRWFTRGWTLQELLAPTSVEFFSVDLHRLGDKHSLEQQIHEITRIPKAALRGEPLPRFSDTERFRWIQSRKTKREEDLAYSLLGIFGVDLDLRYGERKTTAFERLQREVEKLKACCQDLRLIDPDYHKQDIEYRRGGLLEDVYRWILEHPDFQTWRNDDRSPLLWIKGDPGKGKTMLLCGIINELKKSIANTALLSFFFCVATNSRINNATAVLRGLIYMLIYQQPSLFSHIRKKYDYAGKAFFEDSNAWFALSDMFTEILQDENLNNTYLIIDALDECVAEDLPKLLGFIVSKSSITSRVKWIVSSRNWPSIEKDLNPATQKVRLCLELNEDSISTAVATYIHFKVDWLAEQNRYSSDTKYAIQHHLSLNAKGTFLWVALVCQELSKVPGWKVQQKLAAFPPGLDALYMRMIEHIRNSEDKELCISILAVASTVYRPVTLDELAAISDLPDGVSNDDGALSEIIGLCGSFLTLRDRTVLFVHQSAKDFLVQKAHQDIYPSRIENVHYAIFWRSLHSLSNILLRDIYGLGAHGVSIDQVKQPIPDPLSSAKYSCVYWISHLLDCNPARNATDDLQDGGSVDLFLRQRYLYWLEALSLCRSMSEGVISIKKLETLLQVILSLTSIHDIR